MTISAHWGLMLLLMLSIITQTGLQRILDRIYSVRCPPEASLLELPSERIIDLLMQQADTDLKPLITYWDQQGSSFIPWHTACAALHLFNPSLRKHTAQPLLSCFTMQRQDTEGFCHPQKIMQTPSLIWSSQLNTQCVSSVSWGSLSQNNNKIDFAK